MTLTTRFGTSNAAPFSVGDPTPVITSISPNSWNAGTSIQVTITGHGFGTNPSLTITGPAVAGYSTAASDTQIVATVTIAANSPGGAATVEVQSHGYTVSGLWITSACRPKFTVAVAALAIVA
ncbi:MAG TPA: IPT/TIG domain-containing protein [Bryobacteraceae bacterium]|nr:IPT/TIG domain-containing protein [Bryobacteraceae bacterium]